jgi:hypothetical protein
MQAWNALVGMRSYLGYYVAEFFKKSRESAKLFDFKGEHDKLFLRYIFFFI